MTPFKIFIIEDDAFYGEVLRYQLSLNQDFEVTLFTDAKTCLEQLEEGPHILFVDFILPDMRGDEILKIIKKRRPELPVVIISGQEDISVAVNLLKMGASDYLVKNENTKELLWNSVLRLKENLQLKKELASLRDELVNKYDFEKSIIGQSTSMRAIFQWVDKASKSNINVSISGETGTGKELIAKAIHFQSERSHKPFIAVNMGAIPSELIESELFGHEKGAFTGAIQSKKGKFEEAQGGTLFLDEIAELKPNLQSKILRVLQEREVSRIGSSKVIPLDFRLITATHSNLLEQVHQNNFREDLYYRIIGLPIHLPPLRERGSDIILLAQHLMDAFAQSNNTPKYTLSSEAKSKLLSYSYPGNVRELKAIIDLACVLTEDSIIKADDISFSKIRIDPEDLEGEKDLEHYIAEIIERYLHKNKGNVIQTAQDLKIGKSTIYNLIKSGKVKSIKK
jgi:DNA-binding NtrC family response regulator